jgi:hypothetical protein
MLDSWFAGPPGSVRSAGPGDARQTACIVAAIAVHVLIFAGWVVGLGSVSSVDVGAVAWSHRYYYDYASQALSGKWPYRDFAFEYPVLSFPLFLIPRLLAADFEGYRLAFVAEMFFFDLAAIVLIARQGGGSEDAQGVARRLGWYTLFCFLLGPLLIGRFELAPMVLAFAAASWWFSGRNTLGGIAAGLGTLMKVFPGVVAALALVQEVAWYRAAKPRGAVAFVATLIIGLAFWLWLGGGRMGESLGYHAERGLEVGSFLGGIVLLVGAVTGRPVPLVFDHFAYHVAPEWGSRLAPLAFPLQAATLLLVMGRFWRSGMAEGMRYSAAAIVAFIVVGKVLSPQYLIWPLPFLAVLDGRIGTLARRIFLLCCICTALIYPGPGFPMILDHRVGAILLLNLRNALLVWLLAVLLLGPRGGDPAGRPGRGSESLLK